MTFLTLSFLLKISTRRLFFFPAVIHSIIYVNLVLIYGQLDFHTSLQELQKD